MGCSSSASLATSPAELIPAESSPVVPIDCPTGFHSKYWLGEKIGNGSYAQVYIACSRIQETVRVAVKVRTLSSEHSKNSLDHRLCKSAYKEVCLWNRVGAHPNCARMHENFFDDRLCYMVMELCSTNLIHYVKSLCVINEKSLATVFTQMLHGVSHVHSVNISHRDLKPDNFLVGMNGHTIKLIDFGLSAYVPHGGKVDGICGTAPYMCPEMLFTGASDLKADVWSFGVVAYLLLCGEFPYHSQDDTAKSMKLAIVNGRPATCTRTWLSNSASQFLDAMLNRDPELRPTADLAVRMEFFKGISIKDSELHNLQPILNRAARTGAFDSPDLTPSTKVDLLLKSKANACKVLTQCQMDEFVTSSPEKTDKIVHDFWLHSCIEKKTQETLSNTSTCADSSNNSSASKRTV